MVGIWPNQNCKRCSRSLRLRLIGDEAVLDKRCLTNASSGGRAADFAWLLGVFGAALLMRDLSRVTIGLGDTARQLSIVDVRSKERSRSGPSRTGVRFAKLAPR